MAELKHFTRTLSQLDRRLDTLKSSVDPNDAAAVKQLWRRGIEQLDSYIEQPVQLIVGDDPVSLDEASDSFRHWIRSFRGNAVGPGGDRLQDSPARLEKFLAKLQAVEPDIDSLAVRANELISRAETDPAKLAKQATALTTQLKDDRERQAGLDAAIAAMHKQWGPRIAKLSRAQTNLRGKLATLADHAESSGDVTKRARAGTKAIDAIDPDALAVTLQSIEAWVNKYRDDQSLQIDQVTKRIDEDLGKPVRRAEADLANLLRAYDPQKLREHDTRKREQQFETLRAEITKQLTAVKDRYQALVTIRRKKLGSEPDDRYFGTVAKRVNDAITQLGEYETSLLEIQSILKDTEPDSLGDVRTQINRVSASIKELLDATATYADDAKLEETLDNVWKEELKPLDAALANAKHRRITIKNNCATHADHPGMTPALEQQIDTLTSQLDEAIDAATRFRQQVTVRSGSDIGQLKHDVRQQQQRLTRALADAEPLTTRSLFRQLLADEVNQQQLAREAQNAQEKQREQEARATLPDRFGALQTQRDTTQQTLRSILGYLAQLEQYNHSRAAELYEKLETLIDTGVTVDGTELQHLGDVLSDNDAWSQLEEDVHDPAAPLRPLELALSELEVLIGVAGRLQVVIDELTDEMERVPLSHYKSAAKERATLAQERDKLSSTLERLTEQLAAQQSATHTVTAAEASDLVHQLEYDERLLDDARHSLHSLGTVLRTETVHPSQSTDSFRQAGKQLAAVRSQLAEVSGRITARQDDNAPQQESTTDLQPVRQKLQRLLHQPAQPTTTPTKPSAPQQPATTPQEPPAPPKEYPPTIETEDSQAISIRRE